MNWMTLSFKNKEFEHLFRKTIHQDDYKIMRYNFCLTCFISIAFVINCLVFKQYKFAIIFFVVILIHFLTLLYGKNSINLFDFIILLTQIGISFAIPISIFLNLPFGHNIEKSDFYQIGQTSAFFQVTLFLGTRIYLKWFVVIQNLTIQILLFYMSNPKFQPFLQILFVSSCILMMTFLYLKEREKRSLFLYQHQNKQWKKGLDSTLELSILQCSFNETTQQIQLENQNTVAKQIYGLNDQLSFRNFIRNVRLSKLENLKDRQNILSYFSKPLRSKKQEIMLEMLLYNMFKEPKKLQELLKLNQLIQLFNKVFQFIGEQDKNLFQVKVFALYEDKPFVILMIEKHLNSEENFILKQQIEVQSKTLDKINNQDRFRRLLILFKSMSLQYFHQMSKQNNLIRQQIFAKFQRIQSELYQNYNNILNIEIFRNGITGNSNLAKFSFSQLYRQLNLCLQPLLHEKQQKLLFSSPSGDDYLIQEQQYLFQILLNLLYNSIQWCSSKNIFILKTSIHKSIGLNEQLVKFSIEDTGMKINEKLINGLPILNPKQIGDYFQTNQKQKLKLGLIVANYLISRVGPYNYIKITNKKNSKVIEFYIFRNLRDRVKNFKLDESFRVSILQDNEDEIQT